jgi:hypothetical protein
MFSYFFSSARDIRAHAERRHRAARGRLSICKPTGRPAPRRCAARSPGYRPLCSALNYEYVPLPAAFTVGTRRAYGSYWNRAAGHRGARRMDEPTQPEIRQLMAHVVVNVVTRRNAQSGRSAQEHPAAVLRCLVPAPWTTG